VKGMVINMDLQELRAEIDKIDKQLIQLINQRMDISVKVAEYKKQHNLPVHDPKREQEILEKLSAVAGKEREEAITELYSLIFKLSRAEQEKV